MPGVPASPKNSAHTDQPNAASTPTEMSVSIVAAPWRRFAQAALWNGQAPHVATGAAKREREPLPVRELQRREPSPAAPPAR